MTAHDDVKEEKPKGKRNPGRRATKDARKAREVKLTEWKKRGSRKDGTFTGPVRRRKGWGRDRKGG